MSSAYATTTTRAPGPGFRPQAARELAESLLADQPTRLRHVHGAARAASTITAQLEHPRAEAIVCAAWLHDIGYAEALTRTSYHPVDGALYLYEAGWDLAVVSLVAQHSHASIFAPYYGCAGPYSTLTRPWNIDADIVTMSDMLSGVNGDGTSVKARLAELRRRTYPDVPVPQAAREQRYRLMRESARSVENALRRKRFTGD